ncbi:hypothetical protein BGX28_010175 [Mortierella sp. GBA30]|nr:hypothetical protein BGX28_010175 [Mortierella sp. GBA30]
MTRTSASLLLVCAIALLGSTISAQDPTTTTTPATPQCVIHTPQEDLKVGKPYKVTFDGCRGGGDVELRYGDVTNQEFEDSPACKKIEFEDNECTFTPYKAGEFSFSAKDDSGNETFSGRFKIVDDGSSQKTTTDSEGKTEGENPAQQQQQPQAVTESQSRPQAVAKSLSKPTEPKKMIVPAPDAKTESIRQATMRRRALYDMAVLAL